MWALARKVKNIFKSCVFMSCVFLLISCNLCIITSLCKPNLPIIVLHFGLTEKLELNRFFNIKFFSTGGGEDFLVGGDDFLGNSPPRGEDFQGGRISFYTGILNNLYI